MDGRWRWGALAFVLGFSLAAASCASKTKTSELRGASEPCDGRQVLVVRNHTEASFEIVETQMESGGRTVVAIVGPGYREIDVAEESGRHYHARVVAGSQMAGSTSRPRARDYRSVELELECRAR